MADKAARTTQPFGPMIKPGHVRLTLVAGHCPEGMTFGLSKDAVRAGRDQDEINLAEDPYVSPLHATFSAKGETTTVRDENTPNGTFIRIRGPHRLSDGDYFRVGNQLFRFETLDQSDRFTIDDGTEYFVSPRRKGKIRVLQVLEGGKPGLAYSSSTDEITIGGEGASIAFSADHFLSERHARVFANGDGTYSLEDLGSTNGTYVQIDEERALKDGDVLLIGREVFRVDIS